MSKINLLASRCKVHLVCKIWQVLIKLDLVLLDQHISEALATTNLTRAKMMRTGIKRVKQVNLMTLEIARKEVNLFSKIEQDIRVSGETRLDMVMERKYGLMEPNMKVTGKIIRLTDKVFSGMYMVTSMKDSGKETKHMVSENTLTVTAQLTKVTGEMTCNMAMVLSFGTTTLNIKVTIRKERNMDRELTLGKMDHNTQVPGMKIESMVMESTLGMMEDSMKVTGRIIIWMGTEYTPGKMAGNTKDNIRKIKNMEKVYIHGLMEESTMENGKMEDNTVKASIYPKQANSVKDYGQTVKEKNGSMNLNNTATTTCEEANIFSNIKNKFTKNYFKF